MRWLWAAGLAIMAGTMVAESEARPRVETISYETTPCFGTCPVYGVTVSSDGRGVFEGKRFTAVTGRRAFRVSSAEWREFRRRLQPLHGRGTVNMDEGGACKVVVSDMPSVEVRWSGAFRPFTLRMNYGCEPDRYGWMFKHLRSAPDALPIARFVKPDKPFPPSR